ncbi:MAG: hypothetical protein KAJ29_02450 [Alphaproteobacteria bacterium]|nr:hypothetical protein [Alphaproteobacteria bacterium]
MGYFDKIKEMLSSFVTAPPETSESSCCDGERDNADNQEQEQEHKRNDNECCCDSGCNYDSDHDNKAVGDRNCS